VLLVFLPDDRYLSVPDYGTGFLHRVEGRMGFLLLPAHLRFSFGFVVPFMDRRSSWRH
jgi:hypothetical protein